MPLLYCSYTIRELQRQSTPKTKGLYANYHLHRNSLKKRLSPNAYKQWEMQIAQEILVTKYMENFNQIKL